MNLSGFKRKLHTILNDNTSGSTDILISIAKLAKEYSFHKRCIREIIRTSEITFRHFPAVIKYISMLKPILKSFSSGKIITETNKYLSSLSGKHSGIYYKNISILKNLNCIVTISNSRTVAGLLRLMHQENKKLEVIVCESRPAFEGRELIKELLADKITCKLITDASMPSFIEKCDGVIAGADQILSNNDVVNKTGSRAAAICCKFFGKPFYVAATKDKKVRRKKFIPEESDPSEVFDLKDKNLRVYNFCFERIEKKLITKILTD